MSPEVLVPSSAAEAVAFFGDGDDTTVIGGGTVVLPQITYGQLSPNRVLLLSRAGLDGLTIDGDTITGHENWRLPALQKSIKDNKLRPLRELSIGRLPSDKSRIAAHNRTPVRSKPYYRTDLSTKAAQDALLNSSHRIDF